MRRWIGVLAVWLVAVAHADDSVQALFAGTDAMPVSLEGPFWSLAHDRAADAEARPGAVSWKDASGAEVRIPVEIKPRGKSRRKAEACKFPPLRLEFPKDQPQGSPFAGLKKVKLVTHCGALDDDDPAYANRVRLELLLYRVFNRISPVSFRARPLDVTYVDTERGRRATVRPGFLIEPESALAARLGMRLAEVKSAERAELDPAQANKVEVFAYMVGNTDFSLVRGPEGDTCCHNVTLLAPTSGALLGAPYDFDATGVVDPPYARPLPGLGIRHVRQRLYRGHCRPQPVVDATLAEFRAAHDDIYQLFRGDDRLEPDVKEKTIAYLDGFYATIDDPAQLKAKVLDRCI